MTLFRLLIAFIFGGLLTGCQLDDRMKADYRLVKADAGALKGYLRASRAPNDCPPPGAEEEARICLYAFEVTNVVGNLVRGIVDRRVVEKGQIECENTKKFLLDKDLATADELKPYPCFDPEPKAQYPKVPYTYTEYGFEIEGVPTNIAVSKGKIFELESIPQNKKALKYIKELPCNTTNPCRWRSTP